MLHLGICVIELGAYPFFVYTMSRYNVAVVYIRANSMFLLYFFIELLSDFSIYISCSPSFSVVHDI